MVIENKPNSGDYSNSLNRVVFNEVSDGSVCLDVGCWIGNLGEALIKEKRCIVDGVDLKTDVLDQAIARGYRNTFVINFNNDPINLSTLQPGYDYIIFADVLEHCIDPEKVLKTLRRFLKPNGKILVSFPNVAFIQNRLRLLLGKWNYQQFGTLDKTHLKFFTIATAKRLAENSGYTVLKARGYNQFEPLASFKFLETLLPTLMAYQILVVAENKHAD